MQELINRAKELLADGKKQRISLCILSVSLQRIYWILRLRK